MTHPPALREAESPAVPERLVGIVHPLTMLDPEAPLTDLAFLGERLRGAEVVGLGRSTHGAHELSVLTHRVLRFLIERLGFRALAIEDDWTKGIEIDEHLRTGRGDLQVLLDGVSAHWRTEELLDVLSWMRSYNEQHPADPVRFVGLDIASVGALAYTAVARYVRRTAPDRLDELEAHYATLRPAAGVDAHIEWYRSQPDKQPFIEHARRAHDLVANLPPTEGHALAVQHARAIVGFYGYHAQDQVSFVEPLLAQNTIWWHEHTGDKIVYWGGIPHTAVGAARRVSFPPAPPTTDRNAGSRLREHFRSGYVSIGLTFHHGTVRLGSQLCAVPAPSPGRADAGLGGIGLDTYLLDLHADPGPAWAWLDAPAQLRLIGPRYDAADDADHHMSGGSLTDWFDLVVYRQEVTPTRPVGGGPKPERG
jgi:erythromycin esterase